MNRTIEEEAAGLILIQRPCELRAVTVKDSLAALQEGYLQIEVVENLDQGTAESRNLETVFDAANESNRIDLGSNILKEAANEYCRATRQQGHRRPHGRTYMAGFLSTSVSLPKGHRRVVRGQSQLPMAMNAMVSDKKYVWTIGIPY